MKLERGELLPTVTFRLIESITLRGAAKKLQPTPVANTDAKCLNHLPPPKKNSALICQLTLNVKVKALVKCKG